MLYDQKKGPTGQNMTDGSFKHYNLLINPIKIKRTLPEIEKFQKQNPISEDDLNNLIKQQELLIENVKQLK